MDLERAKAITAQCLRSRVQFVLGSEDGYVPLPECTLEEMLLANRIVDEASEKARIEAKPDADSVTRYQVNMTVDPRGIAASYAFEQYGRDPHAFLEAVGLRLARPGDDEDADDLEAGP